MMSIGNDEMEFGSDEFGQNNRTLCSAAVFDALRKEVFDLPVYRTEFISSPGGYFRIQLV